MKSDDDSSKRKSHRYSNLIPLVEEIVNSHALRKYSDLQNSIARQFADDLQRRAKLIDNMVLEKLADTDAFKKLVEDTLSAGDRYQNILKEQENRLDKFAADFAKAFAEAEKAQRQIYNLHQNAHVFMSPFFRKLPATYVDELFADLNKPALAVYHEFFQIEGNIRELIQVWANHKYFDERISILRSALHAHLRKEYELSVPVFLAQINGILSEILQETNHGSYELKLKKLLQQKGKGKLSFPGHDLIVDIICDQMFESTSNRNRRKDVKYPSRHEVLHGSDKTYYKDPLNSTKCILVLDLLRLDELTTSLSDMALEDMLRHSND